MFLRKVKRNEWSIRPGGLMRCCIAVLDEARTWPERHGRPNRPPEEGDKLKCIYCSHSMVYHSGAWEWAGGPRA